MFAYARRSKRFQRLGNVFRRVVGSAHGCSSFIQTNLFSPFSRIAAESYYVYKYARIRRLHNLILGYIHVSVQILSAHRPLPATTIRRP